MNKQTRQIADFNPRVPFPPANSTPVANGSSANFLGPSFDFAEFRGVPIEDRILNVRLQYAAMRNLRAALATGPGEVLGLLLGSHSAQTLCIEGYEPVLFAGENPDFAWLQVAAARFSGGTPGLIGLFRTQLTGRPEITPADSDVIRRHLPSLSENGGFFAVIETPRSNPWSATLFALGPAGTPTPGNSMLEFPFNENLLRKTFSSDFVPQFEAPRPKEIPAPASPSADLAMRLSGSRADVSNSRLWMVGALCLAGVLGLGVFYDRQYQFSGQTRAEAGGVASYQPLGLKVVRSGTDFEVSWDRTSSALRLASDGTLTIQDGDLRKIVNLDPTQLREGRILYAPLFRELTVRFEVSENQRRIAGESVQVLGWDTNPSSGLSAGVSLPASGASRKSESLAQLPMVPPIAARDGKDFAGLAANHTEPRAMQAPIAVDKQSQLPRPSAVVKAPEPKVVIPEARQTVPVLSAAPQPRPAVVTPAQTAARATEPAVPRADSPVAPVPLPVAAAPVVAVAAPPAAVSHPVVTAPIAQAASSQPVSSPPASSQAVAAQPVAAPPASSQPVAAHSVASQPAAPQPIASPPVVPQPVKVTSLQAATLIKKVTPAYPSLARASRIQGVVRFNATIGGDGRIRKLQYTSGPSVLVSAATDAVKQWIYQPTLLNGQPIEVNTSIDVSFVLNP